MKVEVIERMFRVAEIEVPDDSEDPAQAAYDIAVDPDRTDVVWGETQREEIETNVLNTP
ncbi:hypothetical protein Dxin01_00141 [Deinococcus xinjiangensis]|uniref:Uncharacterized protein n=1 Tax=Deinococcus xinjiangensis TaxID=457454 RepID=A0ABP9V8B9_9DEIO